LSAAIYKSANLKQSHGGNWEIAQAFFSALAITAFVGTLAYSEPAILTQRQLFSPPHHKARGRILQYKIRSGSALSNNRTASAGLLAFLLANRAILI